MKFFRTKILGLPAIFALIVVALCLIGIIVGSFADYQINVALKNVTNIGSIFATYGSYLSYCLYPAAGMCLFKALRKKGKPFLFLAWLLLVISYFLAVYYSNSYNGSKVRELFGYKAGESSIWISILAYLFWVILYSWVPVVFYFILDDKNPKALLIVGITILLAGIVADNLNLWLKQVASRPRFKYLITLEDPLSQFKNWWEFSPYKAGNNDSFKSWPSGNMTIACMMFSLPLLMSNIKHKNNIIVYVSFAFAFVYVALYGYNRIHMTNHFLSDVCFGTLFTYLIFALIDKALEKALL